MSENKYTIVRQSVTIEPVKPTLKERVIDGITTVLCVMFGVALVIILVLILEACNS